MNWQDYLECLTDVDPYLARLGIPREEISIDEASLSRLVRAHLFKIPFENIDVFDLEKPILLDVEHLQEKVVVNHRGGYCFELNGVFTGLLKGLGFDVLASACRVLMGGTTELRPVRHRGIIVTIDGDRFFCDVGYGGPSFPGAVPLSGDKRSYNGLTFWVESYDAHWMRFCRKVSPWEQDKYPASETCELLIGLYGNVPADFDTYNTFCYAEPRSPFRTKRRVHLRTETGYYDIFDDVFSIRDGEKLETCTLATREEVQQVLKNYFGIDIPLDKVKTEYTR